LSRSAEHARMIAFTFGALMAMALARCSSGSCWLTA
jgi:hypothetical protein